MLIAICVASGAAYHTYLSDRAHFQMVVERSINNALEVYKNVQGEPSLYKAAEESALHLNYFGSRNTDFPEILDEHPEGEVIYYYSEALRKYMYLYKYEKDSKYRESIRDLRQDRYYRFDEARRNYGDAINALEHIPEDYNGIFSDDINKLRPKLDGLYKVAIEEAEKAKEERFNRTR